jgi:hypothetical protein
MTEVTMTLEAMIAELATLKAQNAELIAANAPKEKHLTCKVSAKGAVSIYGLGRWPVTLYRSQAERLFSDVEVKRVRDFIQANIAKLAVKEPV